MEVFIVHPACSVEVALNDTVLHLKHKVEKASGVYIEALILDGEALCEEDLCAGTEIVDGCALEVRVKVDMAGLRRKWLAVADPTPAPLDLWRDETFVYERLMRTDGSVATAVRLSPLAGNTTFMRRVLVANPFCIQHASDYIRDHEATISSALCSGKWQAPYFAHIPPGVTASRNFRLTAARRACSVPYWPADMKADKASVRMAVSVDTRVLRHASVALRNDPDIVIAAILNHPHDDYRAELPDSLQTHTRVVVALLKRNVALFPELPECCRANKDILETAMQSHRWRPQYLEYVEVQHILEVEVLKTPHHLRYTPSLQGNRRFLLSLARKDASCLQFASAALQSDRSVLLQAMESGTWERELLRYAKPNVTGDKRIMGKLVARDARHLEHAIFTGPVLGDIDILFAAVRSGTWKREFLRYAKPNVRGDKWFMTQLAAKDARHLEYATAAALGDIDVVLAAVQSGTWTAAHLRLVSEELKANRTLAERSFAVDSTTLQYTHASLHHDEPFLLQCVERHGNVAAVLEHAARRLKGNKAFMLKCLRIDTPATLPYVPSKLLAMEDFRAASYVHKPCKVRAPPKPMSSMDVFRARFEDAVPA